jgi:hypothetical protein
MSDTGYAAIDPRLVVIEAVRDDLDWLGAEVGRMRKSQAKDDLEATSRQVLQPIAERLKEADSLADAVRAAHVYRALVQVLVLEKVPDERRAELASRWEELGRLLLSCERAELLVAEQLRHFARELAEHLDSSNRALADEVAGASKALSAINETLTGSMQLLVGPWQMQKLPASELESEVPADANQPSVDGEQEEQQEDRARAVRQVRQDRHPDRRGGSGQHAPGPHRPVRQLR